MIKSIIRILSRPFFLLLPLPLQRRIRAGFNQDFKQERRNKQLTQILLQHAPAKVASGPFTGMDYVTKAANSAFCPKILGSYEKELWPVVEETLSGDYEQIFDVGAAEGYYVAGFATKMPGAHVIAFETDTHYHHLLRELAHLNAVENQIELRGHCSPEDLNWLLKSVKKTIILCDIEGAEMELMNPENTPALKRCDLLIETHDFARPGVATFLKSCFQDTHSISIINDRERTLADWPFDEKFIISDQERREMRDEQRNGVRQEWLWMKANAPLVATSNGHQEI